MIEHPLPVSSFELLPRSGLRLCLILTIALMVISSSIVILLNPALLAAKNNTIDTSNNHATVSTSSSPANSIAESSPSTTVGSPTIQAALSSLTARPTNNIVNTNSFYDVVFLTASSGAIKFIQVTFPAGTIVPTSAIFNEAEGIGPGFISQVSGQTVTYTVNNAVNVPAGTKIRLEFANINNPLNPSANYKVTVTTRNAANAIIDGPTQSTAYTMKQIGSNAIAESFMKKVTLLDNAAGNALGWDPNGANSRFLITEPLAGSPSSFGSSAVVNVSLEGGVGFVCNAGQSFGGIIEVLCPVDNPPLEGSRLDYTIINLPGHAAS